jgi:hypothetical protein
MLIREKHRLAGYEIPYLTVFELGAKLQAQEERRLKAERRGNGASLLWRNT